MNFPAPAKQETAAGSPRGARLDITVIAGGAALFAALLAWSQVWVRHGATAAAVVAGTAAVSAAILRRARVIAPSIAVVLAAFGVYAIYFGYTASTHRNPDAPSNTFYIDYILQRHALPGPGDCTVCHHPPLYYLAGAAVRRLVELANAGDVNAGLQGYSLVVFAVFVVFSALAIDRAAPRPWQRVLATALVLLWPYSVLNSVRIHNDIGFYAVAAATFHYLVRWTSEGRRRLLAGACIAAGAGMLIKANALILVALVVAMSALRVLRALDRKAALRELAPVVGSLLLLVAAHGVLRSTGTPELGRKVLGSAYKPGSPEAMPRSAAMYLTFDPRPVVATPYVMMKQGKSQEPSYWNHLVKSSLFGTRNPQLMRIGREVDGNPDWALAENWALLALMAVFALGQLATWRDRGALKTLSLVTVAVYVGVGLAFHLIVPVGYHADFRFIYPVVVPMSLLYVGAIEGMRRRGYRVWHAGYLAANVLVALSVAYFLPVNTQATTPARGLGGARPGTAPRPSLFFKPPAPGLGTGR